MTTITALDALLNANGRTEAEAESALDKACKVLSRISDTAELTALNVSALLNLHNGLAERHGGDVLRSWKRPKTELVDRITALGAGPADDAAPEATEDETAADHGPDGTSEHGPDEVVQSPTIGALVQRLLMDETLD